MQFSTKKPASATETTPLTTMSGSTPTYNSHHVGSDAPGPSRTSNTGIENDPFLRFDSADAGISLEGRTYQIPAKPLPQRPSNKEKANIERSIDFRETKPKGGTCLRNCSYFSLGAAFGASLISAALIVAYEFAQTHPELFFALTNNTTICFPEQP